MVTSAPRRIDSDFSRRVLEDLYTYKRKSRWVAWLLWATLGWLGAHRFYLRRELTGLAMLLTGGGGLLWWAVDAFRLNGMVGAHDREQARRKEEGLPPVGLDFMPPLGAEGLEAAPSWVEGWVRRSPWNRRVRLAGDLLVLLVAGAALGSVTHMDGALEALVAVVLLTVVTTLGAGPGWLAGVPLAGHLVHWSHRLRLFYHHNRPGSPLALLLRPVLGVLWAPFRAKDRAEVKLYVELGAAFTAGFLLLDLTADVLIPLVSSGGGVRLGSVASGWIEEVFATFFLTYAFTAPIGAVLTLYLLARPTHGVPRFLSAFTLGAILLGALGS